MSCNLVVSNDTESNYELMFTVLSMQVVWELLQSHNFGIYCIESIIGVWSYVLKMFGNIWGAVMSLYLGCTIQNLLNIINVWYLKMVKTFVIMVSLGAIKLNFPNMYQYVFHGVSLWTNSTSSKWIYLMPLLPKCHKRNIFQAANKFM